MTKHKISRRDFLAALAAGTVAATACGLHRTFAEASHTFEYWVLNRELSFRRTREGIITAAKAIRLPMAKLPLRDSTIRRWTRRLTGFWAAILAIPTTVSACATSCTTPCMIRSWAQTATASRSA